MHPNLNWIDGIELHGTGTIVAGLIVAFLFVAEPLLGRASFRRFLRAMRTDETGARMRFYRQWTVQSWILMAVLLLLALTLFGWTPAQLGLRAPHLTGWLPGRLLVQVLIGALIGMIGAIVMARRQRKHHRPSTRIKPPQEVMQMLPRTAAERRAFALLAITAGITEEVVWRGVLLAILVAAFPHVPILVIAIAMTLAFGWAHLYQGLGGVIGTAVLGGLFTALYLASGSLLLPIVLHAVIDLLAILRAPAGATETA